MATHWCIYPPDQPVSRKLPTPRWTIAARATQPNPIRSLSYPCKHAHSQDLNAKDAVEDNQTNRKTSLNLDIPVCRNHVLWHHLVPLSQRLWLLMCEPRVYQQSNLLVYLYTVIVLLRISVCASRCIYRTWEFTMATSYCDNETEKSWLRFRPLVSCSLSIALSHSRIVMVT